MFPIRDSVPSRSVPVVTRTLIVLNALVFLYELRLPAAAREQFFFLFGLVPARYTRPEWAAAVGFPPHNYWPILTHQFLHGGWFHIISNMWALWIFGDNVEDRLGKVRFLVFYLGCGVVAGVTEMMATPFSQVPSIGASGAIAGVVGAYILLFPTAWVEVVFPIFIFPFFFELPAVLYLGFWFISQLFSGAAALAHPGQVGGIAWWAHIGGFVAGMVSCQWFTGGRGRLGTN